MNYLMVKDFAKHQHYRDRNPVWIKLYNSVMDDEAFLALPDAARGHLMLIWLLASRRDNKIPNDARAVGRAIQSTGRVDLERLLAAGFLLPYEAASNVLANTEHGASNRLARTEHSASPEREKEGEKRETSSSSSAADDAALLDAEQRLRGRLDGRGDEIVLRFLGRAGSATRRAAWVGRLGALMDSAPHFTPAELAEGLEALMTEPEESWKPSVLKAWVRRVRTDAEKEQQRPARTASNGAKPSSADDAGAGAVFAKIRGLINTATVVGQAPRKFIRRADVEALGPRVLTAYDNIGGADRFLDPDEQVGFVLRDFTREYGTLHGAAP